ncbi:MAG: hypothetical protein H8D45_14240 [Bacteroidetes bacterium]|nr:hypothetical protein [Bacteroidota bacterium]MBL7103087.1 hypothetical protein [Bacteroidales bacterium]
MNNSYFENYGLLSETFLNGGYCYETEVIDDLMYVGSDAGFLIYDISNIDKYEMVGFYSCAKVCSFYINNDTAYLGTKASYPGLKSKIEIIDISDISNPYHIASYEIEGYTMAPASGLHVVGNYIYVSYYYLYIIDINDLTNPVEHKINSVHPSDLVVENNMLYVATGGDFEIYYINNDTTIVSISSLYCPGSKLQKIDSLIYITKNSLKIVNISDLYNPEILSETNFINNVAIDVKVVQSNAYVIGKNNNNGVFAIVDIINPTEPSIIYESIDYLGSNIFIKNNNAFISGSTNNEYGIITLDIQEPSNVNLINITISSIAQKSKVYNSTAYVANGYCGVTLFNISDLSNPVEISSVQTKGTAVDVLKDSNIVYVAEGDSGIQIIDYTNPGQPEILSNFNVFNYWEGFSNLNKYDNYLYAGGADLNEIIDVSDPENPVLVGQIPINDWSPDMKIMEDHLFVAGYWGGFQIFSLADPVNPVEVGYYPLGLALKIAISKNLGYIYDGDAILIFDISDYTDPILTFSHDPGQYVSVYHMFASGDSLYYSDGLSRINVLDVSNPYNPVIVDSISDTRALSFDFYNKNFVTHNEYYMKIIGDTTIVSSDNKLELREEYYLHQNIPNPCSENTSITISLPETMNIKLELYDNIGRKLNTIIDRRLNKGEHTIMYNSTSLKQGIYYYRLIIADKYTESKKMLVVKY